MKKQNEHINEAILLKVIQGVASKSEKDQFADWIEASPENKKIFKQLQNTWQLASTDMLSLEKNWEKVVQKVIGGKKVPDYIELPDAKTYSIGRNYKNLVKVAAILILILGMSFLLKNMFFNSEQLVIYGKDLSPNEPYQLIDGSLVYLNSTSEIKFSDDFGDNNRLLSLIGEAYFEVQPDKKRPFIINTYNTKTKVVGTSFNVYTTPSGEVQVSVVSGSVNFYADQEQQLRIHAGEQGFYLPENGNLYKEKTINSNFLAWKTGVLVFNETPLVEAFMLLGKQYEYVFVPDGGKNSTTTLTTKFDNQPLDAVLEELNLLLNTKHELRNDTIYFKNQP